MSLLSTNQFRKRPKSVAGNVRGSRPRSAAKRRDLLILRVLAVLSLVLGLAFVALLFGLGTQDQDVVTLAQAAGPWLGLGILATLCIALLFRKT